MKHLYRILICLLISINASAQIINIPDSYLKSKLVNSTVNSEIAKNLLGQFVAIDTNDNNEIEVSEAQQISYVDPNACN